MDGYYIEKKKLTAANEYWIVDDVVTITTTGQQITKPGRSIKLIDNKAFISDEEIAEIKEKYEVDTIKKLKNSLDYKGGYLTIKKVNDTKPKEDKKEKPKKEKK